MAVLIRASLFHVLRDHQAPAPPSVARSLQSITDALRADTVGALRHVDRAWRCLPEHAAIFAPIYARLLSLDGGDYHAALRLSQAAVDLAPDAEVTALSILAFLRLQRLEDARELLERALADYCVEPGGLLARAAGEVIAQPALAAPGWIGRGPQVDIVGELAAGESSSALEISVDGGPAFTQMLPRVSRGGAHTFGFPPQQPGIGIRLDAATHGIRLLGSGALPRKDFSLDGRVENRGRRLVGWARIGWRPNQPPRLRIEDGKHRCIELDTRATAEPSWHWPIDIDARAAKLTGHRLHISAQLPDGRWHALPDAPLLLEPALRLDSRKPIRLGAWSEMAPARIKGPAPRRAKSVDVIIPVYRGREETLACIDAVLNTIDERTRVLVIDDASDDPELAAALDRWESNGQIQLLRNRQNLGFVASVNRGLGMHPTHDAVILNSDTLVFGDWLARLRAAAYAGAKIGTVTPWSNSGSIASYPHAPGSAVGPEAAAALHALAAATLTGSSVEIPVGVGFCLYLRRDCLRDVGELDSAVFGKGYGEETDFCLRARRRGWSHRLAADVFVYHAGGVSFQGSRRALLDRSQRLLNLRHPGFDGFIESFLERDPLRGVRRRLDERRLLATKGNFKLLVTLALSGGVDRFVTERCRDLKAQGLIPLVLRPHQAGDAKRCELWTDAAELPNLVYSVPKELGDLSALLHALPWAGIEIQHFLHLDARVIDMVRALPVPYDVVVHDYSWICPRVTLIDGSDRYCGEPAVAVCETCVRRHGSKLGETLSVTALRARSTTWLKGARHVVAPSKDAASRLRRYVDGLNVEVRPHSETVVAAPPHTPRAERTTLRVALIGAIGTHKGYRILLACARDARDRKLALEFIVIGHTENDAPLLKSGKVFITGRYHEPEAPHLIQREQPDIAWLPSVWPETWCYALDHALGAGLPVAAFDLGAIAERLRGTESADLMPLDLDAPRINDRLLKFGEHNRRADFTERESSQIQMSSPPDDASMLANNNRRMLMTKPGNGKTSPENKQEGLSASVQVLPLPSGLYLFSVKAASPGPASANGQLALPAMHVGLGPGVRSDQVEFMSGPSTHGAWLFSAADLLVTRINGAGATLILTSVRGPGGEVLSITVERLEERAEAATAMAPRSTPLKAPSPSALQNAGSNLNKDHGKPIFRSAAADLPLPVHIAAHIRTRGDMNFANVPWAGRVAPGLWIESFSVRPLERFDAGDIEYKGLTASGFETPWLSDDKMCGTKGMATPLVGFAIRLKPSPAAAAFDCEYSGYFQSGITAGPLRNGAPCRSSVANDSLEGIQVRLVKRTAVALPEVARKAAPSTATELKPARIAKVATASARALRSKIAVAKKRRNGAKVTAAPKSAASRQSTAARHRATLLRNPPSSRRQSSRRP